MSFRAWGKVLCLCIAIAASSAQGVASRYASGLLHSFAVDTPAENQTVESFLRTNYGAYSPDFTWRLLHRIDDSQHSHLTYHLFFKGVRVSDRRLKIHFNRRGFVEYASADWQTVFSTDASFDPLLRAARARELSEHFIARHGRRADRIELEPVIWLNASQDRIAPAFDVVLTSTALRIYRRFLIARDSGEWLAERPVARYADVYKSSPLGGAVTDVVSLTGLTSGSALTSAYLHVRRDQLSGGISLPSEVDPSGSYVGSITSDPSTYAATCYSASITDCPNQAFDAVNVYYHVESFRERLEGYFSTLGASVNFPADPLNVLISSQSVDTNGDGLTFNDTNNAAYLNVPCHSTDSATSRCLVILPPAVASSITCGNNVTFYPLGREALIPVHEYQHYITDTLTQMPMGTDAYNVGDALHEGFSDYMAASHVSQNAGVDVTLVGAYAFQNCSSIQRDVGVLKEYDKDSSDPGPHIYGLSWASGLWRLRSQLGATAVDLLALKTLFLLPTQPGFVDAVEALVAADKALNAGVNVVTIRRLFYQEVKFLGGRTGQFRDPDKAIIEMGLRSCGAVHHSRSLSPWSGVGALLWLLFTLMLARLWVRHA
jgi:hypothetical protein